MYYKKNITWLGLISFYWFILTGFWGKDGHYISFCILFAFFLKWLINYWHIVKRSSLFWLITSLTLYTVINASVGYYKNPETITWQIKYSRAILGLGGLFSLVICPWLLSTNTFDRFTKVFITIVLSLSIQVILALFVHQERIRFNQLINGRPDFHLGANQFGFICAILLMGTICVGIYILKTSKKNKSKYITSSLTALQYIYIVLFLSGLILSQSRSSWLATSIALCFVSIVLLWNYRIKIEYNHLVSLGLITLFILCSFLIFFKGNTIKNRITIKKTTLEKLVDLEFSNLPENSIGKRINMWQAGVQLLHKKIMLGWSPGKGKQLMKLKTKYEYSHFHNMALQIILSIGLFGFILILTIYILLVREIYLSIETNSIPLEWQTFWFSSIIIVVVEGLFDFLLQTLEPVFILTFLISIPITCHIDRITKEANILYNDSLR